jgi:hypothetical protein
MPYTRVLLVMRGQPLRLAGRICGSIKALRHLPGRSVGGVLALLSKRFATIHKGAKTFGANPELSVIFRIRFGS